MPGLTSRGRRRGQGTTGARDLRLLPVAAAGWLGAWLATGSADGRWWPALLGGFGVFALVLLAAAWRARRALILATALSLSGGLVVGGLAVHRMTSGPVGGWAEDRAVIEADAVIRGDPQVQSGLYGGYATVRVRASLLAARGEQWHLRTPLLVVVAGEEAAESWRRVPVGTAVRLSGRLSPVEPGADVAAVLRVRRAPDVRAPPSPSLRFVERVRQGLRDAVAERPAEPRALVPALVLGDTSAMTPELRHDFQVTGLTHLTAASGANLSLLLAFMLFAATWIGVRGRWLRLVGLGGLVMFVALCRTEPSVLRAAAMGLVALAALGAGGGRRGLRHLAVAVLVLVLVDPFLARSVGFVLSVLACAGIVGWAPAWVSLATWLPRPVAEAVAVPLAAHLATLPVVAAYSGAVSVVGLAANAVAGPLVGPATVLGFAAAGLSLLHPWPAAAAGWAASWCAQAIIAVAHAGAALPGASWRWPTTALALGVLAAGALGLGLSVGWLARRPRWALVVAVLLVAALLAGPVQPGWPPRDWRLVACDVGQGDGLVIRVGPGQAVVVDVGPDPPAMRRCLSALRIRSVPVVVLTHFHADHVGGLAAVLGRLPVQQVWVSPYASPPAEAAAVRRLAGRHGALVRSPAAGETGRLGDLAWQVLGPVGPAASAGSDPAPPGMPGEAESGVENDASLVLLLRVGELRLLLTGDVEPEGQQRILAAGADLRADVLKLPHHGSSRQDPAFLAATGARIAIASAGEDNSYGHPAPGTVRLVSRLGMTVLRTDRQGGVAVTDRAGRIGAVTQR